MFSIRNFEKGFQTDFLIKNPHLNIVDSIKIEPVYLIPCFSDAIISSMANAECA